MGCSGEALALDRHGHHHAAMANPDIWPKIRAERAALADDLDGLSDEQWATTSLCDEWTVRDVVAHMTATTKISGAAFFPKLLSNGFSLKKMQAKDIVTQRGASPAETLSRFKASVDATTHPPGPITTWLGEAVVHAEDVRRPLGLPRAYPTATLVEVADFYKGSNLVIGTKKRIAGLRLRATDGDWTHGDGPEVAGPMAALVVAMAGRKAALADLTGDGVATLSSRP
jgi:uncharacterized protein (TIGR03083 family)